MVRWVPGGLVIVAMVACGGGEQAEPQPEAQAEPQAKPDAAHRTLLELIPAKGLLPGPLAKLRMDMTREQANQAIPGLFYNDNLFGRAFERFASGTNASFEAYWNMRNGRLSRVEVSLLLVTPEDGDEFLAVLMERWGKEAMRLAASAPILVWFEPSAPYMVEVQRQHARTIRMTFEPYLLLDVLMARLAHSEDLLGGTRAEVQKALADITDEVEPDSLELLPLEIDRNPVLYLYKKGNQIAGMRLALDLAHFDQVAGVAKGLWGEPQVREKGTVFVYRNGVMLVRGKEEIGLVVGEREPTQ